MIFDMLVGAFAGLIPILIFILIAGTTYEYLKDLILRKSKK